ncbi:hypothetical protein J1605_011829 [Eschrichtius robustus]|uniref:Helicase ATP-binding domain-containing protein n=1 Tax=Eschrichtius robustus TaxID=9764 RepID=A0AB34GKV9_ESCRO|nr:hypothetical protein J1605_011829 [Eschrichtius robustus]
MSTVLCRSFILAGSAEPTTLIALTEGPRPPLAKSSNVMCIPETTYKYPDLPINRCKEEVVSLIESNSVVIIHGATGSGKSTQLPQYILDHYLQRSTYCNIVVTQPRKIGASSIARWISKERAWALGGLVGYQVGLEKIATEDTKLIYMTTGVLLQKIVSAKSLMEFTHVFIDEVHERTEEMDFLLLVVRKLLRTNSRFVKVVLMSATINCKEFARYFAVPVQNKMNPAYVFEVEGKPYSVEEYYLDDLEHIHHNRLSPHLLEEPVITKDIYEVAVSLIQMFDGLDVKESGYVGIFLPFGKSEVFCQCSIILSTNIAESSVTVPDVKYGSDRGVPGRCGQWESFGAAPAGHSDRREEPESARWLQVVEKDTASARGEATRKEGVEERGSGRWGGHLREGRFCRRDRRRQVPEGRAPDSREAGPAGRGEVREVTGTRAPGHQAGGRQAVGDSSFSRGSRDVSDL